MAAPVPWAGTDADDRADGLAPLTHHELARYEELDGTVRRGLKNFLAEVGDALLEIKTHKLWRSDFKTWGAYCSARLETTRAHADRLANFADWRKKFDALKQSGDVPRDIETPSSEGAIRPLMALPNFNEQADLYELLYKELSGPPTRKAAQAAVKQRLDQTKAAHGPVREPGEPPPVKKDATLRERRPTLVLEMYDALDSQDFVRLRELIKELDRLPL